MLAHLRQRSTLPLSSWTIAAGALHQLTSVRARFAVVGRSSPVTYTSNRSSNTLRLSHFLCQVFSQMPNCWANDNIALPSSQGLSSRALPPLVGRAKPGRRTRDIEEDAARHDAYHAVALCS